MSTSDRLKYQISLQLDVTKLKGLRDSGLDKIIADPMIEDFTIDDKAECTTIINERIVELGGEV